MTLNLIKGTTTITFYLIKLLLQLQNTKISRNGMDN